MSTPKPIRRSDGHTVKQDYESDDVLIQRTIVALSGEIHKKQERITQQSAVSRNGQTLVKQAQKSDPVPTKTWEECKQDLVNELLRCNKEHQYDDADDDGQIEIDTFTRGEE